VTEEPRYFVQYFVRDFPDAYRSGPYKTEGEAAGHARDIEGYEGVYGVLIVPLAADVVSKTREGDGTECLDCSGTGFNLDTGEREECPSCRGYGIRPMHLWGRR
jgi:hypothetical protein